MEKVARHGRTVDVGPVALDRVRQSLAVVNEQIATGQALYGVNTGFGSLSRQRISDADLREVQRNLIRSHAAGTGDPLDDDVVRAMMLLLAASLCRGHSGVRADLPVLLAAMLNAGITPVVPHIGSVGASGDLAPLAHCVLVMLGEGEAMVGGARTGGGRALADAGLTPVELGPKEGLALINGTHLMAAQAALMLADAERVIDAALIAAAMSIDACRGTDAFLDDRVHALRGHPGPRRVAARLRAHLSDSEIIPSHVEDDPRVQDVYSLRCMPQVAGAALDAIERVRSAVEFELGAVTDNPLVFQPAGPDDRALISAGAFHGMPIALPLDTVAIALAHVAGISERRVYHILAASDSENPMNPHLSPHPGLHSGLMIVQYTAAACCNELINIATPATVGNIPTSAGVEDYNSFGPRAAAKARRAVELCTRVVATELLCAAEALEYQRPLRSGTGVERAHAAIRERVPRLTADRPPAPDIEEIVALIQAGRFG